MRFATLTASVIAASQIILGLLFLCDPAAMFQILGVTAPAVGVHYVLGMLAARFLVYGGIMLFILRDLQQNRLWLDGMMAIQAIDLIAGLHYTATGAVSLGGSAFPMANASLFLVALAFSRSSLNAHAPAL